MLGKMNVTYYPLCDEKHQILVIDFLKEWKNGIEESLSPNLILFFEQLMKEFMFKYPLSGPTVCPTAKGTLEIIWKDKNVTCILDSTETLVIRKIKKDRNSNPLVIRYSNTLKDQYCRFMARALFQ